MIRQATEEDLPEIMEMDKATLLHDASLCGIVPENIEANHQSLFEKALTRFEGEIWVAEIDNTIAGFIWVIQSVDYFSGHPIGFVLKVYVKKEFRNQNIGDSLAEKAEEYCIKNKLEAMEFNIARKNVVPLHMAESRGYEIVRYRLRKSFPNQV